MDASRTRRDDIKAIRTTRKTVELALHEYWCETKQAFEIRKVVDGQEQMLQRIPRKSVLVIIKNTKALDA